LTPQGTSQNARNAPNTLLATEMAELEAAMVDPAMVDPARTADMDAIVARYGEVQGRFEGLDGYALESRAREVLAGLSFSQERMDGERRRPALRQLEDARGARPHPADAARRHAAGRAEQPSRPRKPPPAAPWLRRVWPPSDVAL